MPDFEQIMYALSAAVQIMAMAVSLRMMQLASNAKPWLILFIAMAVMLAFRFLGIFGSTDLRQALAPTASLGISLLLLVSFFMFRTVALAERASKKLAEQRTSERDASEQRYRALVELSPDPMFVHVNGKIVYVNEAAVRFFHAKHQSELLGNAPLDLIAPESKTAAVERIAQLNAGKQSLGPNEQIWKRLDGSLVHTEAAGARVPWHGGWAIQSILRDITERKKAEEEKTQLLNSERLARTTAENANRAKDEFLATLSHELRTPLTAILGWAQILGRGSPDENEVVQGITAIERSARAQTRIIEDLLEMSRIVSGKLRLDVQRVQPIAVVESAVATIRPSAAAKAIRLEIMLDPIAGPVLGDPHRLQQVIWNLLSNAVKFTPKQGKIQVSLQRVNSHIEITVADTGEGISADFLPYVFDRFRQADGSLTRRHGGLGIGLALVRELVELHGGSVRASSEGAGKGSIFVVELPVTVVQPTAEGQDRFHPTTSTGAAILADPVNLSGVTVLVVDDEPDAYTIIKRVLSERKANVLTANSAAEAMPLIESNHPDVLVSDIGMPGIDGYEFLKQVRAMGPSRGGRLPAVALTAFARSEDRTRALMAGYSVHVAKPVEPDELVATVASLVGRAGASSDQPVSN